MEKVKEQKIPKTGLLKNDNQEKLPMKKMEILEKETTPKQIGKDKISQLAPETIIKINEKGQEISSSHKKKKTILFTLLGILGMAILIVGIYVLAKAFGLGKWEDKGENTDKSEATETAKIEVKDHESPLTGNLITQKTYDKLAMKRPLSIIVENHVDARPQSGLNEADVVWEALAEGGISRFMAIFLENQPDKVGPVRSIRKYFLDWNAELRDGLIMHVGYAETDNPDTNALGYIYQYDVKSLGIFVGNSFWRDSDRVAPHDAYTSTKELWKAAADQGWTEIIDLEKRQFKDDSLQKDQNTIKEVSFNWEGWGQTDYSVKWTYDLSHNVYLREQNKVKHVDSETGDQVFAKNVVLMICDSQYTQDTDGKTRLVYNLIGEGEARIFLDGKAIEGKWKKLNRVSRTKFYNEDNVEIKFNRGRTWISVLPTGSEITY